MISRDAPAFFHIAPAPPVSSTLAPPLVLFSFLKKVRTEEKPCSPSAGPFLPPLPFVSLSVSASFVVASSPVRCAALLENDAIPVQPSFCPFSYAAPLRVLEGDRFLAESPFPHDSCAYGFSHSRARPPPVRITITDDDVRSAKLTIADGPSPLVFFAHRLVAEFGCFRATRHLDVFSAVLSFPCLLL